MASFSSLLKDYIVAGVSTAINATSDSSSRKRNREEEDEERHLPILIHKPNHDIRDNAHDIIDFEARRVMGKQEDW